MTRYLRSLEQILDEFDVAVLDQWGVLHDGSTPYPHAVDALEMLARHEKKIVVLSNSGKRAAPNLARIKRIGLPAQAISHVVTSGEALWEDLIGRHLKIDARVPRRIYPIGGQQSDASEWADDSDEIELRDHLDHSVDAIMLMGLPDGTRPNAYDEVFQIAIELQIALICSNPDKKAPRAGGLVMSPGALADRFDELGGEVVWYGKPHGNVYRAVRRWFPDVSADRFLMVGDSIEHDVAGGQNAGFLSAFIRSGIHANDFADVDDEEDLSSVCRRLVEEAGTDLPDYSLQFLA